MFLYNYLCIKDNTMEKRDKIVGASREILVALGALLFAFFPSIESYWNEAVGVAMLVAGLGFAIKDKTLTSEYVVTTVRKLLTFVGIVFASKIPSDILTSIATVVGFIIPIVWQAVEKSKK
jgi:hypothetical protein